MGLWAEFHLDDYQYPNELYGIGIIPPMAGDEEEGEDGGSAGEPTTVEETISVDYSDAFQACMDTFMNIARSLVPIDTGYLYDSIGVEFLGDGVAFYANADYAQYVEFGTSRMLAQEYFQPALEEAMRVFHEKAQIAISWADEVLQGMVQGLMDASMAFSESMGMGFMGGIMTFAVLGFVLFPVFLFAYAVADVISIAIDGGTNDGVPEIQIT